MFADNSFIVFPFESIFIGRHDTLSIDLIEFLKKSLACFSLPDDDFNLLVRDSIHIQCLAVELRLSYSTLLPGGFL